MHQHQSTTTTITTMTTTSSSLGADSIAFQRGDATTLRELLSLQRQRAAAHHTWQNAFQEMIRGKRTSTDFDVVLSTVLKAMQGISAVMRAARDGAPPPPPPPPQLNHESEAESHMVTSSNGLRAWVAALQEEERKLYEATTMMQQVVVRHLLPPPPPPPSEANTSDTLLVDKREESFFTHHCADCVLAGIPGLSPAPVVDRHLNWTDLLQVTADDDDDDEDDEERHAEDIRDPEGGHSPSDIRRWCRDATDTYRRASRARAAACDVLRELMDEASEFVMDDDDSTTASC